MKKTISSLLIILVCAIALANELRVSSVEPIIVVAPDHWQSAKDKPATSSFPFETYRLTPPSSRNAVCLVSIFGKNKKEYSNPQILKNILRGDSRPYVSSPDELPKIELKEMKIEGGAGFYVNFVDPDLVGKPVIIGSYKTATPIILNIGSKYLIKVSILCDDINGVDYREAVKIVESIKIKQE